MVAGSGISSIPPDVKDQREQQLESLFPRYYRKSLLLHVARTNHLSRSTIPTKYQLLTALKPAFFVDDRWPHCAEAVAARVPFVGLIQSIHDGDGAPLPGVPVFADLATAVQAFLQDPNNAPVKGESLGAEAQ